MTLVLIHSSSPSHCEPATHSGARTSILACDAAAAGDGAACGGAVLLAVGTAGGMVWLWRLQLPAAYTLQQAADPEVELV